LPAHRRAGAEALLVLGAEELAVESSGIRKTEIALVLADSLPAESACRLFPVTHNYPLFSWAFFPYTCSCTRDCNIPIVKVNMKRELTTIIFNVLAIYDGYC
jgi:hypothetical protein